MEIEGIKIDESNREFKAALELVKGTRRSLFLSGKAGTGKTTFLKCIKELDLKRTAVLAPTGISAVMSGGQTIHSFFHIRPGVYRPDDSRLRTKAAKDDENKTTIFNVFKYKAFKKDIIRNLETLVIDEVSMVRCDLMDVLDRILQVFRGKIGVPFGGVQMVFVGDVFQLPPVVKDEESKVLSQYYDSRYFFSSNAFRNIDPVHIELKKIYRQTDQKFIDILNRIRVKEFTDEDLSIINQRYIPGFEPEEEENYIRLGTHNSQIEGVNEKKLEELPGEKMVYQGAVYEKFEEKDMVTSLKLELKVGAQVMVVKNMKISDRYIYNGMIGKITQFNEDTIKVHIDELGDEVDIERVTWENIEYHWDSKAKEVKEKVVGTFTQFPLKLAWAITVHKSQGMTFDRVFADLSGSFERGQVYVALSRCVSLDGLVLKGKLRPSDVKMDQRVLNFTHKQLGKDQIEQELISGKADYHYYRSLNYLKQGEIEEAIDEFYRAYHFRNDLDKEYFKRALKVYAKRYFDNNQPEKSKRNDQITRDVPSGPTGPKESLRRNWQDDELEMGDWNFDRNNPAHDPSENPWIDVYGPGEEAETAYWNTE